MTIHRRIRDAITGRFARPSDAVERPETTVTETVEEKYISVPPGCAGVVVSGSNVRWVRFEYEDQG